MSKEELNELLDTVYELEGLVHLALTRDDNENHLTELIGRKAGSLASMFGQPDNGRIAETTAPSGVATPQDDGHSREWHEEAAFDEAMAEPVYGEDVSVDCVTLPESDMPQTETYVPTPDASVETPARQGGEKGKPVFSLNDRYRFRRELFGNSNEAFNEALAQVAALESFDEAEGYFIEGMGWDPDNQDVRDFLNVLQNYYK